MVPEKEKSRNTQDGTHLKPDVMRSGDDAGYQSILNITNLVTIAILIGLIMFLVRILSVFGIFIISFIIAFLLYPMVDWLSARRVPRVWGILLVYLLIGAVLFAVIAALIPVIVAQSGALLRQLPIIITNFQEEWTPRLQTFLNYLQEKGIKAEDIQNYINQIVPSIQKFTVNFGHRILIGIQGAAGGIVAAFTIPIIVFYLLLDAPKIKQSLMRFIPHRATDDIENLLDKLSHMLNHYIRGQLKLCFVIFLFCTTGLLILGVPHALLLGVVAGITEVVPIVGPIIAFIPAFIVSVFLSWDYGLGAIMGISAPWARGLIIICFYLLMQWCENNLIVPRIMGKDLNLHPLTVMFALLAGGFLGGIFGMLVALPIAACLKVVFEIYYSPFIERVEELIRQKPLRQTRHSQGE